MTARFSVRATVAWCLSAASVAFGCATNDGLARFKSSDAGAFDAPDTSVGPSGGAEASVPLDASLDASRPDARPPEALDSGPRDAALGLSAPLGVLADGPSRVMVRVAHFVDDGPAIHVCVRPSGVDAGTAWLPVTGSPELGGLPGGLAPLQVTAYVSVPSGGLDVRVVAASAGTKCPDQILTQTTLSPVEEFGTILLRGSAADLDVALLVDRPHPDPGASRIRFVHAAPEQGAVSVGTGLPCGQLASSASYATAIGVTLPSGPSPGPAKCGPTTDDAGYATVGLEAMVPPLPGPPIPGSAAPDVISVFDATSGGELDWYSAPAPLTTFDLGRVSTVFLHEDPTASSGLGLVVCDDAWPSFGALTTCVAAHRALADSAVVWLTNGSPRDTFDVCLANLPLALPAARVFSGLSYLQSRAVVVPVGSSWNVKFVPEGASCGTSTAFSREFSAGSPGVQVIAVPGPSAGVDAAYSLPPDVVVFPQSGPIEVGTVPVAIQPGAIFSAAVGVNSNDTFERDLGPVPLSPDPASLTSLGAVVTEYQPPVFYPGASYGGVRLANASFAPSQVIGSYTRTVTSTGGDTPFGTNPIYGPAVLRQETSVPVVTRADHTYAMTFVAGVGTELTDLLVCDLTAPPETQSPPPCDSYTLVKVP